MSELLQKSKKKIHESQTPSLKEIEKVKIELEAKARLFQTSFGLIKKGVMA